jgi:hypothetical protein
LRNERIRKKYFNKVNGKLVRIRFSDTNKIAEDPLKLEGINYVISSTDDYQQAVE